MSRICIIPARGGSKRIPGKNIKLFCGKPIIAYSIEAALKSNEFDEVMVSTDDQKIADIALAYGAKVPFLRSEKTADDFATIADVILEVIAKYEEQKRSFSHVACLFATAPFISDEKIKSAIYKLENDDFSSVFFVQEFTYTIWRSLKMNSKGVLSMNWPENLNKRSQDLPKAYHDAGLFYIAKSLDFLSEKTFFTTKSSGITISDLEARDIDTEDDWIFAETLFKIKNAC